MNHLHLIFIWVFKSMWWISVISLNLLIMIDFNVLLMMFSKAMSLNQCNCSSLICIVLLSKLFWTASNDICELHMHWINWLVLKSVLLNLLKALYLKFQMCLMLCQLLLIESFISSHLAIRLNWTTLSTI